MLITGRTNATVGASLTRLWRNNGTSFTDVTSSVAPGLPGVRGGSVAWGDYDNDGRLDFSITGDSSGGSISQLWRNTGTSFTNATASVAPGLPGVVNSSVAWGDYDNDGRLDFLITGDSSGGKISQLWRNNLAVSNTPPTAPTGVTVSYVPPDIRIAWNPSTDDHTPPAGLTYNVRVGTTPGGSDVLSPSSLSDGTRLLPARGNAEQRLFCLLWPRLDETWYVSVQAVDSAFAGSAFSTEVSFRLSLAPAKLGDANSDGVVSQNELNTVLNNYWQISPPLMQEVSSQSNTVFNFALSNLSSLNFHVLASTNVALPLNQWVDIGPATLQYQFTDPDATNYPVRFYQLIWP